MASNNPGQKRYTPEEREKAIALAEEVGNKEASRQLGIPMGSVGVWRAAYRKSRASKADLSSEQPQAVEDLIRDNACATPVPQDSKSPVNSEPESSESTTQARGRSARVARLYTPSQRAKALEMMGTLGPSRTSRELGISRFSLHEWHRKHQRAMAGNTADSPLAGTDEDKADKRDARILAEWKAHPGLGPSQIRNQLRRQSFKVSVRTVRMVMEEHGYVTPKVRRVESHDKRYEAVRPNQLWHTDFLQRHINKQKISVLFFIDDFSRYITGFALWDEDRSDAVFECFESATTRHGRPESVMSDGGAAFWSWHGSSRFTRLLEEMGIDQIIAKVPQHNGKVEVLNANVQKELFNQERFFDLGEALARLRAWVSFYNLRRTHHALGGLLVPADRYFGRAGEVLAHIEAGREPQGVGEPISVAERQLDLLRVTSRAGKVEVMLMGERIWPQPAAHKN